LDRGSRLDPTTGVPGRGVDRRQGASGLRGRRLFVFRRPDVEDSRPAAQPLRHLTDEPDPLFRYGTDTEEAEQAGALAAVAGGERDSMAVARPA